MYDRTNVLYSSIIAILNKYKFTHIQSIFPRLSSPGNGPQVLRWVHLSGRGPELINSWKSYLLNCKLRPRMPAYEVSATSGRRGRGWHDTEWQQTRTVTIRLSGVHPVWCKICMQPGFLVDVYLDIRELLWNKWLLTYIYNKKKGYNPRFKQEEDCCSQIHQCELRCFPGCNVYKCEMWV